MSKFIRVFLALILSMALSCILGLLLPYEVAMGLTMLFSPILGVLAISDVTEGLVRIPPILRPYAVAVDPSDYVAEPVPDDAPWDSMRAEHLLGVPWHEAEAPPRRHDCWPQSQGWMGFDLVQRCACGAMRLPRFGDRWTERNSSRRAKIAA